MSLFKVATVNITITTLNGNISLLSLIFNGVQANKFWQTFFYRREARSYYEEDNRFIFERIANYAYRLILGGMYD